MNPGQKPSVTVFHLPDDDRRWLNRSFDSGEDLPGRLIGSDQEIAAVVEALVERKQLWARDPNGVAHLLVGRPKFYINETHPYEVKASAVPEDAASLIVAIDEEYERLQMAGEKSARPIAITFSAPIDFSVEGANIDCDVLLSVESPSVLISSSAFKRVTLKNFRIHEFMTVANCEFGGLCIVHESKFPRNFSVSETRFTKNFTMKSCELDGSLILQACRFDREVSLQKILLRRDLHCAVCVFSGATRIISSSILGVLSFWQCGLCGVDTTQSEILKGVDFRGSSIDPGSDLIGDYRLSYLDDVFEGAYGDQFRAIIKDREETRPWPKAIRHVVGRLCGRVSIVADISTQWEAARSFGSIRFLSGFSLWSLVLVPVLAGVWVAIPSWLGAAVPPPVSDELISSWEGMQFPVTLVLVYFSALFSVVGKFVYDTSCPSIVKGYSRREYSDWFGEIYEESSPNRNDGIRRAIAAIRGLRRRCGPVNHPNIVNRHGIKIWIPSPLDIDLLSLPEPEMPEYNAPEADGRLPVLIDSQDESVERIRRNHIRSDERSRIIMEEGSKAEYAMASRQRRFRSSISCVCFYLSAASILLVLLLQLSRVISAVDVASAHRLLVGATLQA